MPEKGLHVDFVTHIERKGSCERTSENITTYNRAQLYLHVTLASTGRVHNLPIVVDHGLLSCHHHESIITGSHASINACARNICGL